MCEATYVLGGQALLLDPIGAILHANSLRVDDTGLLDRNGRP